MNKVAAIIRNEYKCLIRKPKLILVFLAIIFMIDSVVKPMKELSIELGYTLNIVEPILFLMSKGLNIVIIPIVVITIFSDFPQNENSGYFVFIRNSRLSWYIGETIFAFTVSIIYVMVLFVYIAVYTADNAFISNEWSDYTLKTYIDYPDVFLYGTTFLDTSVYTQGKPIYILLQTSTLLMLYIFIIIMLMMLFKIIGKKSMGIIIAIGMTFVGLPSYAATSKIRWIFPITHVAYNWHFNEFFAKPNCSIATSYIYLSVLAVFLVILNAYIIKHSQVGVNYE